MSDPADIGAKVLANLEAGRRRGIAAARERAAQAWRAVRRELDLDVLEGHAERGRAVRIHRRLWRHNVRLTERQVRKILERLASGSDCL